MLFLLCRNREGKASLMSTCMVFLFFLRCRKERKGFVYSKRRETGFQREWQVTKKKTNKAFCLSRGSFGFNNGFFIYLFIYFHFWKTVRKERAERLSACVRACSESEFFFLTKMVGKNRHPKK